MKQRRIVVVGGGASGMMAGIAAARAGVLVTIIEQKDQVGKKILATGNGRCNLTNEHLDSSCYRGEDTSIIPVIMKVFSVSETLCFFRTIGLLTKSRDGYVYPLSNQASAVLDILRFELRQCNIKLELQTKVLAIEKNNQDFIVRTDKNIFKSDAVIIATGGKAAAALGSDGSGYEMAKSLGHSLTPVVPALVQLRVKGINFKPIAGVRTDAGVQACVDGCVAASDRGELQLTEYGISGIPVFQISRYIAMGVHAGKKSTVNIDFLPSLSSEEFQTLLRSLKASAPAKSIGELLIGVFHKKLIGFLLQSAGIKPHIQSGDITVKSLDKLLQVSKGFSVDIQATNSFDHAQVCAGGVRTTEINPKTMQSCLVDNLYLTGELLDIDGICGGYNLQFAWSTGYIAGTNAAKGRQHD